MSSIMRRSMTCFLLRRRTAAVVCGSQHEQSAEAHSSRQGGMFLLRRAVLAGCVLAVPPLACAWPHGGAGQAAALPASSGAVRSAPRLCRKVCPEQDGPFGPRGVRGGAVHRNIGWQRSCGPAQALSVHRLESLMRIDCSPFLTHLLLVFSA